MAREFYDGFELDIALGTAGGLWDGGTCTLASTSGHSWASGNYLMRNPSNLFKSITARADYYCSFRTENTDLATSPLVSFRNGTTYLGEVFLNAISKLEIYKGYHNVPANLLGTGETVLQTGVGYRIEIYYKASTSSDGAFYVKINGLDEIIFDGISALSASNIDRFYVEKYNSYYDDFVFDNANWIGNTRFQKGQVTGNGDTIEFTRSAGTYNYECVDEIPPSDTDYNYSNLVNKMDLFSISNMVAGSMPIETVKGVQVIVRARRNGASVPTRIAPVIKIGSSGAVEHVGTAQEVAQDEFRQYVEYWETNPDASGTDFTESDINDLQIGYKSLA